MKDLTPKFRHGANTLDRGKDHSGEWDLCSIPQCNRLRADNVGIQLCERHIEQAWAAHQIITGQATVPELNPDPNRDVYSLAAQGTVYFIRIGDLLKIGWTSKPLERMRSLKPDAILHFQPGSRRDEAKMHAKFIDHLVKGREWFEINADSMSMVKDIQYTRAA